VKAAWTREPSCACATILTAQGVWSEAEEKAWAEECGKRVDEEINAYLETRCSRSRRCSITSMRTAAGLLAQRAFALALEGRR
jgi:pyruvate dehydrogenase E1 component alpha subunit